MPNLTFDERYERWSTDAASETQAITPTGNRATYTFTTQEGLYNLVVKTSPSITAIKSALNASSDPRPFTGSLRFEISLTGVSEHYADYVTTGDRREFWQVKAQGPAYRRTYSVTHVDDNDLYLSTSYLLRRGFVRQCLEARFNGDEAPTLWDYLRSVYDPSIMTPEQITALRLHVSNREYLQRFHEEFAASADVDVPSWTESFGDFQRAWSQTKREECQHPVLDTSAGALRGLSTFSDERGRSFGVEMEVDFPAEGSGPFLCRSRLAERLYQAGLARDDSVHGWHHVARARNVDSQGNAVIGYTDARNGWSVERDSTVDDVGGERGCEVVSPIMYDTPEHWQDLSKVCEIITDLGGKVTVRHGGHINIGARDFALDVGTHYRLTRLMRQFDDVLIRLAHSPEIGRSHRGRAYCSLEPDLRIDRRDSLRVLKSYHSHRSNINLDHMPNEGQRSSTSTRVEFRIFDGTLDAGRIQMNVRLSMALINAAIRGVEFDLSDEPGGTHRTANSGRRLSGEEWKADTERFRMLVDALFVTKAAKQQALTAYAASRWQHH